MQLHFIIFGKMDTPKQLEALQLAASCANLLPNSDCQTKPHLNNNKLHC